MSPWPEYSHVTVHGYRGGWEVLALSGAVVFWDGGLLGKYPGPVTVRWEQLPSQMGRCFFRFCWRKIARDCFPK